MNDARPLTSSPLAWGLFLGVSWTWCIGMFAPVLLVRDYGPWAWVIFAVPNCIGAAAMGWAIHSADDSRAFVQRHRLACQAFSLVTIAFQIFFAIWMLPRLVGPAGYIGVGLLVQAAFTPVRSKRTLRWMAGVVYAISLIVVIRLYGRGALVVPQAIAVNPLDLLGLACMCTLGFLLSPYLDLTFHQARQATNVQGGRVAFAIGFLVIFAAMIVLTFFYADTFVRMRGLSAVLLCVHLAVQMAFTVDAHSAALAEVSDGAGGVRPMLSLTVAVGFALGLVGLIDWSYHGLPAGEIVYRTFMAFYGLVVPAYLLTTRARHPAVACAAAIFLAFPAMWIAFMERRMPWAIAAAAVLIAVAAASRIGKPQRTSI